MKNQTVWSPLYRDRGGMENAKMWLKYWLERHPTFRIFRWKVVHRIDEFGTQQYFTGGSRIILEGEDNEV